MDKIVNDEIKVLKSLMIPICDHISNGILLSLVTFFLENSTLMKFGDDYKNFKQFPFKCVSLQISAYKSKKLLCVVFDESKATHSQSFD